MKNLRTVAAVVAAAAAVAGTGLADQQPDHQRRPYHHYYQHWNGKSNYDVFVSLSIVLWFLFVTYSAPNVRPEPAEPS